MPPSTPPARPPTADSFDADQHSDGATPDAGGEKPTPTARQSGAIALGWAHTARFLTTAAKLNQLPRDELPEVAFVGRSNAGKSTAINTLAQQRQLAYASKTPGRTQHINMFHVGPKAAPDQIWADLPGYGYAAVERDAKLRWQAVMADYLATRRNLAAVVQMVDSRHGFTPLDRQLLEWMAPRVRNGEIRLLVLLTKADKLNRKEQSESMMKAQAVLGEEVATDEADIGLCLFSALKRIGVEDVAATLQSWALPAEAAQALATQRLALAQALEAAAAEGLDAQDLD